MLEPTKDDSGTYDDEINPFKEFKGSEESLEEEELGLRRDFEVTAGTGKIIVDTFGWYIPPKKPRPPVFPRPAKAQDVEKPKEELGEEEGAVEVKVEEAEELGEEEISELPIIDEPTESTKQVVKRYTFINSKNTAIQVINYGATVISISVADKNGHFSDVILGFDKIEDYQSETNPYFGGTLGRFSSIISDGTFKLGSEEFYLSQNSGQNHVLGGCYGFDKVMWDSCVYKDRVIMTYVSMDVEEGYPGILMVQTEFSLTKNNSFIVHTKATSSKPTIIGLSNNLIFNLAGHGTGPTGLKQHSLIVNADKFVKTDFDTGVPTGELQNVGATFYDLRVPRPLSKAIVKAPGGGYDQTFCLTKGLQRHSVSFATRLVHPESGRFLEIQTDQPGLHVYTCNRLPNPDPTFVEEIMPEEVEFKCRMEFGDGGELWPMRVLSKQIWERPVSEPEEEHVFPVDLDETISKTTEAYGYEGGDVETEASMYEHEGDTDRQYVPPFDPETFYRDEAESIHEEAEVEEMFGQKLIEGKSGCMYRNHGGILLMPQEYPDAPRFPQFPSVLLQPSKEYSRTTIYRFGIVPLPKTEDMSKII
ncbi:galactose mutarotase-like isoform X2 [Rhodnius prolixus]